MYGYMYIQYLLIPSLPYCTRIKLLVWLEMGGNATNVKPPLEQLTNQKIKIVLVVRYKFRPTTLSDFDNQKSADATIRFFCYKDGQIKIIIIR